MAQLGGEGRGSMNLGQTPKIFYFFFLMASLNLMQQNQRNGVEQLTYVTIGFERHNALI